MCVLQKHYFLSNSVQVQKLLSNFSNFKAYYSLVFPKQRLGLPNLHTHDLFHFHLQRLHY